MDTPTPVLPTANAVFRRKRVHMAGNPRDLVAQMQTIDGLKQDFLCPDKLAEFLVQDSVPVLHLSKEDGTEFFFPVRDYALGQIAGRYPADRKPGKVGKSYASRMHSEAPGLFCTNFNHWLARSRKSTLWRTVDGEVRAALSQRFRMLDNTDVVMSALKGALAHSRETNEARGWFDAEGRPLNTIEVFGWHMTENRVHVMLFDPTVTAHLPTLDYDPNVQRYIDGGFQNTLMDPDYERRGVVERMAYALGRNPNEGGTLVFPAVEISNSEVGGGKAKVTPMGAISICSNLCKFGVELAQIHVGSDLDKNAEAVVSLETRRKVNEGIYSQIEDVIGAAFRQESFEKLVTGLVKTMEVELKGAVEAVEVVAKREGLSEKDKDDILAAFESKVAPGKATAYDAAMAVTSAAQKFQDDEAGEKTIAFEDSVAKWLGDEDKTRAYFAGALK